jgi:hypothetical protein
MRRPILGFGYQELVDGFPNKELPLIIGVTISNHELSRILIDEGSSFNIMYKELFSKLKLKKEYMLYCNTQTHLSYISTFVKIFSKYTAENYN